MITQLNPWQMQNSNLAPGSTNDRIAQARADREAHEAMVRSLNFFPDPKTAKRDLEIAAAKLAAAVAERADRKHEYAAAKSASDGAAASLRGAELELAAAEQALKDARAAEVRAYRDGVALLVDVDAAELAVLRAKRKVAALRGACDAPNAATAGATERLGVAARVVSDAKFAHAKAQLGVAASEALPRLVGELSPLLDEVDAAMRSVGSNGDAALREARGMRERIARGLAALLPEEINRLVGVPTPRPFVDEPEALREEDGGIVMFVKPGERYGDSPAGTRVVVSASDLAQRAIASCLESEAERDARLSSPPPQRRPSVATPNHAVIGFDDHDVRFSPPLELHQQSVVPPTVAIVEGALKKATELAIAARGGK